MAVGTSNSACLHVMYNYVQLHVRTKVIFMVQPCVCVINTGYWKVKPFVLMKREINGYWREATSSRKRDSAEIL